MLLFRLILLFAMIFIAYRIYHLVVAPRVRAGRQRPPLPGEDMVECAYCAVRVPRITTIADGARWYCCAEHRHRHADGAAKD